MAEKKRIGDIFFRGPRVKSRSGINHIMLRGANRQEIFHDDEDCIKFIEVIEKVKIKTELRVFAWCLMSNHGTYI